MEFKFTWVRSFIVLCLAGFITACDSSSIGPAEAIPTVQVTPPPPQITMTVVPSLGLITGASATLSSVDGIAIDGATGQTDDSGQVTLSFPESETGPFLITVSGSADANYFDEALNAIIAFPEGVQIRAIIPSVQDIVGVTPLTEIAVARFVASGGANTEDVAAANEAVRVAFLPGITDITAAPTVLTTGSDLLSDSEADIYATYLATLANLAPNASSPALEVTVQLALDFSDGSFDTAVDGTAIEMSLFDNQSAGFNAQLNGALQSSLAQFAQATVSASSFASVLGSGFTVVDPVDDTPTDDTADNGDDTTDEGTTDDETTDDDTTSPPSSTLTDGATKVASFAGSYTFLLSQITDSTGQTAPNSNQVPGTTIDIVISDTGLVSFPTLDGVQQVDFNAVDNVFQELEESVANAGYYRSTTPVGADIRESVFIQFKGQDFVGFFYQNFVVKDDGSSGVSEVIAVRLPSAADSAFFADLSALGSSTLTLVDIGDSVLNTPYLCDQREYTFEVPSEIIIKDTSTRINRSLPPLVITEIISSSAQTKSAFDPVNYDVTQVDDGARELNLALFKFVLASSSALSANIKSNDLTASSLYTNESGQVAALNCPASRSLIISETGLSELVAAGNSDSFVRITTVITATGDIEGTQLSQPVFIADHVNFDDVSSIEYTVPEGFDYSVSLSSGEAESDFCRFSDDAIGTMGSSDVAISLDCTVAPTSALFCPSGGVASVITQFPTRTSGDGDGVLQLTFENPGSPVTKGTDTRFTLSSSGRLFIDNVEVSETPYVCPASSQEIYWLSSVNGVSYTMSLLSDGSFNEFNLSTESDGFVGQYTDEAGDFSDLVYDLSTAVSGDGS